MESCKIYAKSNGMEYCKEYIDDGYSGEFLERPGLEKLRNDLRSGTIKHVIVYDPDRLSRNLTHMLLLADDITSADAQLHFITGSYDASPEGKLFFAIRGAVAEFEKAKIMERTLKGKRTKALSGKLTFNDKPFGYNYDSLACMYTVNKIEAETVKLIYELYVSNLYGVRGLKADLTARGILNKNNVPFTPSNLTRILANEMYAGTKWAFKRYDKTVGPRKKKQFHRDKSEWIPVTVPAIIPKELWQQAQDIKKRNTIMSMKATKYDYLLRNIAKCRACGYALKADHILNKQKDYFYYVCSAQSNEITCTNRKYLPSDKVDNLVWNELVKRAKGSKKLSITKPQNNDKQRKQIEQHLMKLKDKQTAMLKWVSAGTITINDAEAELQNIAKEISASKMVLAGLTETKKPAPLPVQDILSAVTFADKRKIMLGLGYKIYAEKVDGKIKIDFSL